jgi:hypothetical protein
MEAFLTEMPLAAFVSFVLYSPPSTAVFHCINEGWTADTHKISDLIEWIKMLLCTNAENPEQAWEQLDRERRPGMVEPEKPPQMTIGEYMRLSGMED